MKAGQAGYSLVELVAVLVVMGVVAAAVLPSLSGTRAIDDARFLSEVRDALRHAQRQAIAQRRATCASFTATSVTLTVATAAGGACASPLAGPGGEPSLAVTTGGAGFASVPSDFSFDALGVASIGQTLSVAGATIVVEAGTGYVR